MRKPPWSEWMPAPRGGTGDEGVSAGPREVPFRRRSAALAPTVLVARAPCSARGFAAGRRFLPQPADVPHQRGGVLAARDELLAIRREREGDDRGLVPRAPAKFLPRRRVQQYHRRV